VVDYMQPLVLPASAKGHLRTVVFFPGSTIGNFEPVEATAFLARLARLAGPHSLLILGADATRDEARLVRAYADEEGVTAAFNKNVLAHLNRKRGASFDLDAFEHRAVWNRHASRVEMHLVSLTDQVVRIDDQAIALTRGEPIVTEHCYKHAPAALQTFLHAAGWHTLNTISAADVPYRLWLCES
jgi:L-histidine Nalpha-methyltransferase